MKRACWGWSVCLTLLVMASACSDRTANINEDTGVEDTGSDTNTTDEDTGGTESDATTEEDATQTTDATTEEDVPEDTGEADVSDSDAEADVSDPDAVDPDATVDPDADVSDSDVEADVTDPDAVDPDATVDPDVTDPDTTDPDVAEDTVDPDAVTPGGDEPGPGDLVIVEIQGNPNTLLDENAEYIEIQNVSSVTLDLLGVTLAFADWQGGEPARSFGEWEVVESVPVAAGERVLLVRSADATLNGGLTADHVYGGNATELSNSDKRSSRIRLYTPSWDGSEPADPSMLIDEVKVSELIISNATRGQAWQLDMTTPTVEGNDDESNWCLSPMNAALEYSSGNYGTPGNANTCNP